MSKNDRKKDFIKVNEHGHVIYVHKKHKKEIKENASIICSLREQSKNIINMIED